MKNTIHIVMGLALILCCCTEKQEPNIVIPQNSETVDSFETTELANEFEYEIDKRLSNCCADSSSNYGMKMCTLQAISEWESEMDKYYELLLNTLNGESKAALIESQNIWKEYSEKELKLNHSVYNQLDGTIWGLTSLGQTMDKIKERTLHLKRYYNMLTGEGLK